MKKYIIVGLIVIVLIISVYLLFTVILNPSRGVIKNELLKVTPIGTSMEDVISAIESKNKWKIRYIDYESGYRIDKYGNPDFTYMPQFYTVVGEKSIEVFIGVYLKGIYVSAYYAFDENSNLIDILVYKEWDLP